LSPWRRFTRFSLYYICHAKGRRNWFATAVSGIIRILYIAVRIMMRKSLAVVTVVLFCFVWDGSADTFTHKRTGQVLHGFATQKKINNKTIIRTVEKGVQRLDLAEYDVKRDYQGRRNNVIFIRLKEDIQYQAETEAFENALIKSSNKGPLFIVVEIDSPGGRVDLCKDMCDTIEGIDNCLVVAYISGGKYGGAYSAAAAVALACDKIYMADNTAIGAATPYVLGQGGPKDMYEVYGKKMGQEKLSAFSRFFALLAVKNGKPGLLASAMVDSQIEVIEVSVNGRRRFLSGLACRKSNHESQITNGTPFSKQSRVPKRDEGWLRSLGQWERGHIFQTDPCSQTQRRAFMVPQKMRAEANNELRVWSRKGSLLTLPGPDALECTIADGIVNSRFELLKHLDAGSAVIIPDNSPAKARQDVEKAKSRIEKAITKADYKIKQLASIKTRDYARSVLGEIVLELRDAVTLARKNPDLNYLAPALKPYLEYFDSLAEKVNLER